MTFAEYIQLAVRTECNYVTLLDYLSCFEGRDKPCRILHACIGLATESFELLESKTNLNTKEELGDLCWYCAVGLDALGRHWTGHLAIADDLSWEELVASLCKNTELALDHLKKVMFYGKPLNEDALAEAFFAVLIYTGSLAHRKGWTLEEVMDANIRKLQARYPEKFEADKALNRDIDREMTAVAS